MAPLQFAVYWRLALIFFFMAFLFFLDLFAVSRATSSCNNVPGELPAASRTSGEVSSSAHTQNWTTWEVREVNGSLLQVLLPQQDEITGGNDTERENGTVCMDSEVMSYSQTIYMTGLLLGSLFGGALSDSFSLGVEWSLPRYRIWPPALLSFSFSLGMMALAPLAYLTHTWTQLHLGLAIPQILCLPLYYYIPESPHWLLLKRRAETLEGYRRHSPEDKRFLDLLLDTEAKDLQEVHLETHTLETGTPDSETHTLETGKPDSETHPLETRTPDSETHTPKADTQTWEEHTLSHCGHMRSPTILLRLVILSYIGLASALTYYGICMNVGRFGVDVFLAQFFSGLSEAPCLLVPFLLARWGRRPISMLSLFLSGSFCLLSLLASRFYAVPGLVMTLALVGKLCMQTTVFVSVLYGIELFPTLIRQKCVGLVCLCYRVGCILNAVISPRGETIPLAAMILYGSGPIVGAGLCLFLPETSGVPLPDSLEDCDRQPNLHLPTFPSLWSSEGAQRMPQLTKSVHSWETQTQRSPPTTHGIPTDSNCTYSHTHTTNTHML
uniref:solute carrier family 22 member 13-like isoform X2 n=1 Tax=Oncorhynchus gorbuscha TaxID=8017 RepID=UPI001EAF3056|nr:solute carrier family 22 member 13-like isoform X2 [Oncorhynchus gorbuscha]